MHFSCSAQDLPTKESRVAPGPTLDMPSTVHVPTTRGAERSGGDADRDGDAANGGRVGVWHTPAHCKRARVSIADIASAATHAAWSWACKGVLTE